MKAIFSMLVLSALAVQPLAAADGVIEINQDCAQAGCYEGDVPGFPVTLGGGSYRLTSNLVVLPSDSAIGAKNAITIAGGGFVDLDLNGFSISTLAFCNGDPVTSCSPSAGNNAIEVSTTGARIHNGSINGASNLGIKITQGGAGTVLEDLNVSDCNTTGTAVGAISVNMNGSNPAVIRNVRSTHSKGAGFYLTSNAYFSGVTSEGNSGAGMDLEGPHATVLDSNFTKNAGVGLNSAFTVALGRNSFYINNGGGANPQLALNQVANMGGNVCGTSACP